MAAPTTRTLGRSGIAVSALGLGCWPIGGAIVEDGRSVGWGDVDDGESIRALRRAVELGVTFFDTSDVYGRSEELLGRAFAGRRAEVVLATKFGKTYDRERHEITGVDLSVEHMRRALAGSLRRLATDYVDLYQLHVDTGSDEEAAGLRDALEELVRAGTIRAYGWSTNTLRQAELFAAGPRCAAVQHYLNVLEGGRTMTRFCERTGLASIARGPLAMGLLSGKYTADSRLPAGDVRGAGHEWMSLFPDGRPSDDYLGRLSAIRELLTTGGRTLGQGALAWIWGFSDVTIPIPGFKTIAQVEENAGALALGPLSPDVVREIDSIVERERGLLLPLEEHRYDRFLELFGEFMPANADQVFAEMGLTRERVARLPHEVGELRQVEEEGKVAGYLWLEHRDRELHVHALLLEEEFRGHGLGGRVLAELEDEFRGRVDAVELGVLPDNARALALYEHAGFERVGERLGFLILRKRLA